MSAVYVALIILAVIAVPLLIIAGVKTFRGGGRLKEPRHHPGRPDHVRCPACGERQTGNAVFPRKMRPPAARGDRLTGLNEATPPAAPATSASGPGCRA